MRKNLQQPCPEMEQVAGKIQPQQAFSAKTKFAMAAFRKQRKGKSLREMY